MKTILNNIKMLAWTLPLMASGLSSCDSDLWTVEDENKGTYVANEVEPISTTLELSGEFEEWVKVLNYSESYSVLNALYQGTATVNKFTHFAPTDAAVKAFYQQKGVQSIEDLGKKYALAMVQTMTCAKDSMKLSEMFGANVLSYQWKSVAQEEITAGVDTEVSGFTILNASGKAPVHISRSYITCSNGFVYVADGVLAPLVETVLDRLTADGKSSVMLSAIAATGYDKQLSVVADTTYVLGKRTITPRSYTLLNVTDAVFASAGIQSLADLKGALKMRCADASADQDSLLKQYVEYHLFDQTKSREDLLETIGSDTVRLWETMAKNQILVCSKTIDHVDTVMGEDGTSVLDTTYISFLNVEDLNNQKIAIEGSDIIAKNGYVHLLTGWLPVYEPKPTTVVWDLCEYTDVRNAVLAANKVYQPAQYGTSEVFTDISSVGCFQVEKSSDEIANKDYPTLAYVTSNANMKKCNNFDRLVINVGYMGKVSMKTPTLAKGKYKVTIQLGYTTKLSSLRSMKNCKGGMFRLTVDGEHELKSIAPYTTITSPQPGVYSAVLYDEIEFDVTNTHTFEIRVLDSAASTSKDFSLQFDTITFTPIDE